MPQLDIPGRLGVGTTSPLASLHVESGAIMPSVGGGWIMWPADPGGGGGDRAYLRYYPVSGETTLARESTTTTPTTSSC